MNKTINDLSTHHCSGCGACTNVCPFNAIEMIENDEGYLFPKIIKEKCTNCGLCYKTCPSIEFETKNTPTPKTYAMMADDKIRKTSSSGGMFSILANYVFEKKGVVCGVQYSKPFELEFAFAKNNEELEKLKGSKYFQAKTNDVYKQVKDYLNKNTLVLFSGCPCHVAALKKYLNKDYDNLITVDIICHGVPSHKIIENYISTITDLNSVEKLSFRNKDRFKWSSNIHITKTNGEIINLSNQDSSFFRAFDKVLCLRESCYNCHFAKLARVGDFTLGDYWGIWETNPSMNDGLGTSCVLLNNHKAEIIFKELEKFIKIFSEMPLETATRFNGQIERNLLRNPNRNEFLSLLNNKSFDEALAIVNNKSHFDVGVIGYWYATNYGSVITYYALYKTIEQLGYKTVILDRPNKWEDREPQNVFPRKFMSRFANVSESYMHHEGNKYNELCNKFVVGSDQVWTPNAILNTGFRFFLDFASDNKTKVAYAPSFGQDKFEAKATTKRAVSYYLSRFDAVSVRENTAVDICKKEFDIDAVQIIDPIFLQPKEFYENLAEYSTINEKEPYVLSYILDPDEDKRNMCLAAQKEKGCKLINLLDGRWGTFDDNNAKLNLPNTYKDIAEEDWIKLFRDSEYVVTDSHHGFALAVMFNKPVICIMNKARGGTRFTSLLGWLGMLDRLVDKTEDISTRKDLFETYNYKPVNNIIDKKRKESIKWLSSALAIKKNNPSSIYDLFTLKLKELEEKIYQLKVENDNLKNLINPESK